jgi:hypothetical protein
MLKAVMHVSIFNTEFAIVVNRLKWWPVNQHDLLDLIDIGLVEIQNDAPVLTTLGVNAVI